jgi:hypothetical protein
MAQRYCTMLRQALSRLVRIWSASRPTTSVKLLAGITSILLLNGWFSSALAGEVKLTWDTPTGYTNGTQGRALAGYRLYVQDTTGGTPRVDEVGKQTTYTLTGLTEGRTYAIAVTALDTRSTGNESGKSNTITVSVPRTQSEGRRPQWGRLRRLLSSPMTLPLMAIASPSPR